MITVTDWMTQYMDLLRIDRAPKTLEQYETLLKLHILPAIGGTPMDEVTPMAIDALTGRIRAAGHDRTAQQAFGLIKAAYRRAMRYDMVDRSPCDRAEPVRHKAAQTRCWTAAEAAHFLAETRGSYYHAAWVLMICCGLRRGEVLGLQKRDIDTERMEIRIERQRQRIGGAVVETTPKSESSRAAVPLDEAVAARLAAVTRFRRKGEYLYPEATPEGLRRALRRDMRQAGVPEITLHGLRHTFGAVATGHGVPMRVLQELMRHADFGTTARTYAHVERVQLQGAAAEVAHLTLNQGVPGSSP